MSWKLILKRDCNAIKWLTIQGDVIKLAAVYMGGPNNDPHWRIRKAGEHLRKTPLGTDAWGAGSSNWAIFVDENWLDKFANAPEKIQKAADRLISRTTDDKKVIRQKAILNLPADTTDVDSFLLLWASREAEEFEGRIASRSEKLRLFKKLYHKGPAGYKIGHVIRPYFKQDNSSLFTSMSIDVLESAFRRGFERIKPKFGRHDVAYAFEDPDDAIRYGFDSGRVVYAVEPIGPTDRRDMNAIDTVEQIFGSAKSHADVLEDFDEDGEPTDTDDKIYLDGHSELARRVIDAYWLGKSMDEVDWNVNFGENYSGSYFKPQGGPVWEIVCAVGLKVVGIEDESIDESMIRKYIKFVIAEIKNEF